MYDFLKKVGKRVLPKQFIKKHEQTLRKLIALKYRGSKYRCNLCGFKLKSFIELPKKGKLCPNCGSLPRTRQLWNYLDTKIDLKTKTLLHFSPPRKLSEVLKNSPLKNYVTTDFEDEFRADKKLDITNIEEPDYSFDYIICFHVLEHIEKDNMAISELYRILKNEGICFIQTPFKEGEIYEDFKIVSKDDRLLNFGQEDHVRIYSVQGLKNRLEKVGFRVEVITFEEDKNNYFGLPEKWVMLRAEKL